MRVLYTAALVASIPVILFLGFIATVFGCAVSVKETFEEIWK